jgi:hypothetical protein
MIHFLAAAGGPRSAAKRLKQLEYLPRRSPGIRCHSMAQTEQLGVVSTRTGTLIIIDTGYLNLWSHDRPPLIPEGALQSEELTQRANSSVDLRVVGADAERAGTLLEMSWHPLYIYDQPADHRELRAKFDGLVRSHHLDARLEKTNERIPHKKRVELALQHGGGAGEMQFHGVWAVAVGNVPHDQELAVMARRSESEPDRWSCVWVECRTARAPILRSEKIGVVGVDYARLLIADLDVIGHMGA